MIEVLQSVQFAAWLNGLRDRQVMRRIVARLVRLETGNFGDVKPVGGGVSEMRFDFGPGYRVYYIRRGATVVMLLCGGDKTTQVRDIEKARRLAAETE